MKHAMTAGTFAPRALKTGALKTGALKTLAATTIVAATVVGGGVGVAAAAPLPQAPSTAVMPVDAPVSPAAPGTTRPLSKAEALQNLMNELGKGFANGGGAGTAIGGAIGLVIGCLSMFPGSLAGCMIGAPTGSATGAAIGIGNGNPAVGQAIQDYLNAPN